jgi:hypothetical protein
MRYVVLKFDDNEAAERFVAAPVVLEGEVEVMALFAGPTQFCTCTGSKGRIHAWTLGQKYGWWVCKQCKKPAEATAGPYQQMRFVISQGRNLLDEFLMGLPQAKASVWEKGWGVLGRSD